MDNWKKAIIRADEIDRCIIDTLESGYSFRVEAGAGAGKTYSLLKVISWLEKEKKQEFLSKGQRVACITYTNAAVDVIRNRLASEDFIQPCTIHNFTWGLMRQFQSSLIRAADELGLIPAHEDDSQSSVDEIRNVAYELGVRYVSDGTLYLEHNDVINLFVYLLDSSKFRMLISKEYPLILIDEYQDSFKSVMNQFLKYFINSDKHPQFGLFGDSWQTIYSSTGACGEVVSEHLLVIKKEANFRSQKNIVEMLNKIRPELPQFSALDENDGRIIIITTDDFKGERQQKYYKGELPDDVLFHSVDSVRDKLSQMGWTDKFKTLMLTHKMLAKEQHYDNLLDLLGDHLKNADDEHFLFFRDRVEPFYKALTNNDSKLMFEALGVSRRPIESKAQKKMWKQLCNELSVAREGSIADVMNIIKESKLIGVPDKIDYWWTAYKNNDEMLFHNRPIKDFYSIKYSEILNAIEFQTPDAEFSTDHGVKGEEYDSVLLVLGRGWNLYKFDELLYRNPSELSAKEIPAYIRNRNLFYVCCSRAVKNFAMLITVPVKNDFKLYLNKVFGSENIMNYSEFMSPEVGDF